MKKIGTLLLLIVSLILGTFLIVQNEKAAVIIFDQQEDDIYYEKNVSGNGYYRTGNTDNKPDNETAEAEPETVSGNDTAAETDKEASSPRTVSENEQEEGQSGKTLFSPDDWRYILVNKQHPIPEDYEVELGSIHTGQKVDARIVDDLEDMLSAAAEDGVKLLVISPYRSEQKQKGLFDKKVKRALRNNENYLDAYKETAQAVTIPGFSEHELGLAVDLTTKQHITLDADYAETEGGRWLSRHCMEYGFILRYPLGKEKITGIEFEPWHFRYVGRKAAEYIMEHDLTLEEFVQRLSREEIVQD
ncbi:MAG: M15 family metallopeptidase [Lachnospiraceae bacterium]|nr:M15 family metallopeptidase [Lachnospiraceae bacterium]